MATTESRKAGADRYRDKWKWDKVSTSATAR
jgi:hypothetical protein